MNFVNPFIALLPDAARVSDLTAVPYDVVTETEVRAIVERNPLSFLRMTRPEVNFPIGIDPHSEQVYHKAREVFQASLAADHFTRDTAPAVYVYSQSISDHSQRGLVCCYPVDLYDEGLIVKHENTRADKEKDRTDHLLAVSCHPGPLFLAYRDIAGIDAILERETKRPPLYDLTSEDGVSHQVWKISNPEVLAEIREGFSSIPNLYIADGHHRAAAASRARATLRAANPRHNGSEDYNFSLGVMFPADQLRILPYNRVIVRLPSDASTFLKELSSKFNIFETEQPRPREKGRVNLYLGGKWWQCKLEPVLGSVLDQMDVNQLQQQILQPFLGITNPRTDKNIDFIGGTDSIDKIERRVQSGEAQMGISLYPTQMDEFLAVSDARQLMPPKSTWFEPKLRSGFFIHTF
ncbi:MAG: hypothetical protein A2284_06710 [Deltaproteobacteria bacterium RIFOXYA12_FULL_61_11]|nr:MAG: hypothetical protein A2284_06710 [Deltaproteobacteria bacterium RIFOXYA12_FULL_61_11]